MRAPSEQAASSAQCVTCACARFSSSTSAGKPGAMIRVYAVVRPVAFCREFYLLFTALVIMRTVTINRRFFMRVEIAVFGFITMLLFGSLAYGQVTIDVSKVTCDQFANGKVGEPRTTAIWLNGYYHGKNNSTTIDAQQSEDIFGQLMNFCRTGENGKILVMQVLDRMMKRKQ